jgi:hypothetical protein
MRIDIPNKSTMLYNYMRIDIPNKSTMLNNYIGNAIPNNINKILTSKGPKSLRGTIGSLGRFL